MKIKFTPLILILLFVQAGFSQELDWESGTFVEKKQKQKGAQYGTMTTFKIVNINKFLYSVSVSGSSIELNTPIPTELQTLFRLSSSELQATADNQDVDQAIQEADNQSKKFSDFSAKKFSADFSEVEKAILQFQKISDIFISDARAVSTDIQSLKQARIRFVNCAQMDVSYSKMTEEILKIGVPENFINRHKKMIAEYNRTESAYQKVRKLTDDPEIIAVINKLNTQVTAALKSIEETLPETLYSDIMFLKSELSNEKNFIAIAPPVQADADLVNYEIKITPTQTNTLGAHKSKMAFDFDVPVKGGWKADFSVGPTFSFGDNSRDEKYYLEESTTTPGDVILRQRNNNNAISPGIAAMMHFYTRKAGNVAFGGMFGVGAGFQSADDADVSFYAGGSIILGKREKIMINAGISYLNVERLKSSEFVTDTQYTATNIDLNDVTEKVFDGSFFISISYAITQAKVK